MWPAPSALDFFDYDLPSLASRPSPFSALGTFIPLLLDLHLANTYPQGPAYMSLLSEAYHDPVSLG